MGRDGVTHGWWWRIWEEWRKERLADKSFEGRGPIGAEMVKVADGLVAKPLGEVEDKAQCKENRDKGFPIPVPRHPGMIANRADGMNGVNKEAKEVNGINGGYHLVGQI